MKPIRYLLPIIPVSINSIHNNFYQHVCSVLECFSYYDPRGFFVLPDNKTINCRIGSIYPQLGIIKRIVLP